MRFLTVPLLALTLGASTFSQTYTVTTVAGGGLPENMPALNAGLGRVTGVLQDGAGNTLISLGDYNVILRMDADGHLTRFAGTGVPGWSGDGGPAASARLSYPAALALGPDGSIYIVDSSNRRIRRVADGTITTVAGNGTPDSSGDHGPATGAGMSPTGVAVAADHSIYISEGNRVRCVSSGVITTYAGTGTAGRTGDGGPAALAQLYGPMGVAVDSQNKLYIADTSNFAIRLVSGGIISTFFAGSPNSNGQRPMPLALAFDAADRLYMVDSATNSVGRVVSGTEINIAGSGCFGITGDGGSAPQACLYYPSAVSLTSAGDVLIADTQNFRVRKVTGGVITTVAGNGTINTFTDNVAATSTQLFQPTHIASDDAGNLYVADSLNYRVRRVADGTISTVAGSGTKGFTGDGGPAINAQIGAPRGIAAAQDGTLYFADNDNNRVRQVILGTVSTAAGTGDLTGDPQDGVPPASTMVAQPSGLTLDDSGRLLIAGTRVQAVSDGTITTLAGGGGVQVPDGGAPARDVNILASDLAVSSTGDIYLAAPGGIFEISAGMVTPYYSLTSRSNPVAVALDSEDNVYFADTFTIQKIKNGTATVIAGTGSSLDDNVPGTSARGVPASLAVDACGDIYFADQFAFLNRIRVLKPDDAPPHLVVQTRRIGAFSQGQSGATYYLRVSNCAADPTSGLLTATETVPTGLSLVSMTGAGWSCDANTCTRSDVLKPGGTYPAIAVRLDVAPDAPAQVTNQVSVTGGGLGAGSRSTVTPILPPAPSAPVLTFPANGATGMSSTPTLAWNASPGASAYDVYLHQDINGVPFTPTYLGSTTSTSYSPLLANQSPLYSQTIYRWKVVARNGAGTAASSTWSFTTQPLAALTITSTHTGNFWFGENGAQYTLTVSNGSSAGATNGRVEVQDDISAGLTASGMRGQGWVCGFPICTRSDVLLPGQSYPPIYVTVDVSLDAPAQTTNHASVSGGYAPTAYATDATNIVNADPASPTTLSCAVSAEGTTLRPEGITEPLAPVVLTCGGTNIPVNASYDFTLDLTPLALTSDPGSGNYDSGVTMTVGSGSNAPATHGRMSANSESVNFSGVNLNTTGATIPTMINQQVSVSGLRINASNAGLVSMTIQATPLTGDLPAGLFGGQSVTPTTEMAYSIPVLGVSLAPGVGVPVNAGVIELPQGANPAPLDLTKPPSANRPLFSAVVTQMYIAALSMDPGGSRLIFNFTNMPPNLSLYVLPRVTLSDAISANLIVGADANGAGGSAASTATNYYQAQGMVVYQLSGPIPLAEPDTASFPFYAVYDGTPALTSAGSPVTLLAGLGPLSTVEVAQHGEPVPRFKAGGLHSVSPAFAVSAATARLTIVSSHSGDFVQGQTNATYTLTATKRAGGDPSLGSVTVAESLPTGLTLVSMSGSGWTCSSNTCTRGDASNSGSDFPTITVQVNVASDAPASVNNHVSVLGSDATLATAEDMTTILPLLDPSGPALASPVNNATGVSLTPVLSWASMSRAVSYDVYFGTATTPPFVANVAETSYSVGTALTNGTAYHWRVVARNGSASTSSATWSFTTLSSTPPPVNPPPVLPPFGGGGSCVTAVTPVAPVVAGVGGTLKLAVSAGAGCTWSMPLLPAWITIANSVPGLGPQTLTLSIAANPGAARSAKITVGAITVTITQAMPCPCTLAAAGQGSPSAGGSGIIQVVTTADCVWALSTPPNWVTYTGTATGTGNGSVSYQVAANTGTSRSGTATVGGATFAFDQNGATPSAAGTLAHFAQGAGWLTQFTLVNTGYGTAHAQLNFFDDAGGPIAPAAQPKQNHRSVPSRIGPDAAGAPVLADTLNPGAVLHVDAPEKAGDETTGSTGWAQLVTDGMVAGYGVFRLPVGTGYQEAVVAPETRNATTYYLPFDNTGGYYYGFALSNATNMPAQVGVTIRDAVTGKVTRTDLLSLPSSGHRAFVMTQQYPDTLDQRGTLQFSVAYRGQVTVLGLRFNPTHAFTSVPALVAAAPAGKTLTTIGSMPHIAAGGGWKTLFMLANPGTTAAKAHLDFAGDDGKPLQLTLSLPQSPSVAAQKTAAFEQTLAPGTMLEVVADGPADIGQQGWAQLQTDGSVTGFAAFQYQPLAGGQQEAVVPLENRGAGTYILPLDNIDGYFNGIALANLSEQKASVAVTIRDAGTGKTLATDTINLLAKGHTSFLLKDRYAAATSDAAVTVEFATATPGQIGVLGLRFNANAAFTSVPALVRQ